MVERYFAPDYFASGSSSLPLYSLPELRHSKRSDHSNSDSSISSDMDIPRSINVAAEGLRSMLSAARANHSSSLQRSRLRPGRVRVQPADWNAATGYMAHTTLVPHDFVTGLIVVNRDSLRVRCIWSRFNSYHTSLLVARAVSDGPRTASVWI